MCYIGAMTKLLEQTLREVERLPEAGCCRGLLDYVKHMRDVRLTDAQVAVGRNRRRDNES
jgi:hypothetical protein